MQVEAPQLTDLRDEARRVLAAARERELAVRLMGGVAVSLRCPSASHPPLAREYKDIDLAARHSAARELTALLTDLGYEPDEEFNALNGRTRLLFHDQRARQLDVILDRLEMCHELDLRDRLELDEDTLTPADLLLTKLQVFEVNERDLKDATALLHDHHSLNQRVAEVLGEDWGWWRTATANLDRIVKWSSGLPGFEQDAARVRERVAALRERIDAEPKGLRWKARAKVGDRVQWYEVPEEVEQ